MAIEYTGSQKYEEEAREAIRAGLRVMKEKLDHLEQTTHGSLFVEPTIKDVCQAIVECGKNPRGFTVSELSQQIAQFLKAEEET